MEPSCQIYQKDGSCPRFFKGECRSTHPAVCQHNNDCFDERCKYLHERGWCRFAKSCNKPDCIFRHPRQCKFGVRCKNKERDCPFRHLKEDKPRSEAAKPEKPSQTTSSTLNASVDDRIVDQFSNDMAKAVKDFDSKISKMKVIFSKYQARETSRGNARAAREIAESSMDAAGRQRETCQIIWQRLVANAPKMTAFDFSATAWREMYRLRNPRHILSKRIDIERLISSNNVSLICGAIGSGKSSQVPQFLADHPLLQDVLIYHLVSSDIEAECLADRVALEYASGNAKFGRVGLSIGLSTPQVTKTSKYTRVVFTSYCHFFKLITSEGGAQLLSSVGFLIMDDAHTRPRHLDLVFGWINHSPAPEKRPRVVLLSSDASGQIPNLVALNAPPSINLQKPKFPIKIVNKHCGYTTAAITDAVVRLASQVVASSERFAGDILCFLPSKDEVDIAVFNFTRSLRHQKDQEVRTAAYALHSKQSLGDHRHLLQKSQKRRVIFCDRSGEASVGISAISCVIDCGFNFEMVYNDSDRQHRLKLNPISRAEAEQRASIVSSLPNGYCYRLYAQRDLDRCADAPIPDVLNGHLPGICLQLLHLGVSLKSFPWVSNVPNPADVDSALSLLEQMNMVMKEPALSVGYSNSPLLERFMDVSEFFDSIHSLALISRAVQMGISSVGADLAALMLVSSDVLFHGTSNGDESEKAATKKAREPFASSSSDMLTIYRVLQKWRSIRDSVGSTDSASNFDSESNAPSNQDFDEALSMLGDSDDESDMEDEDDAKSFSSSRASSSLAASRVEIQPNFDLSDSVSIASAEEKTNIEDNSAEDVRALAGHVRKWSKDNFINNAALRRAASVAWHLKSLLAQQGLATAKDRAATDDEIRHLVLFASAPNLSVHIGEGRFRCITSGFIAPINAFSSLVAARSKPKWIVWQSTFKGTFCDVTAVEEAWLSDFSHVQAQSGASELTVVTLEPIPSTILNQIFGRNMSQKDDIMNIVGCKLEVDLERQSITAFCSPKDTQTSIEAALKKLIDEQKRALGLDVLEEEYLGHTTFVFGSGGEIVDILGDDDAISVELRDIAQGFDLYALKAGLEHDGFQLRKFVPKTLPNGKSTVVATCESSQVAKSLMAMYPEWKPALRASQFRQTQTEVFVSWANGPMTGKLFITFATHLEANAFIRQKIFRRCHAVGRDPKEANDGGQRKPLPRVQQLRNGSLFADLTPEEAREFKHFKVKVSDVNAVPDLTEDTARETLAQKGFAPLDIVIARDEAPSEAVPEIVSRTTPIDCISSEPWADERARRAGIVYQMSSWAAANQFCSSDACELLRDMGDCRFVQPIGIAIYCRSSIAIAASLWKLFGDEIDDLMSAIRRLGVLPKAHHVNLYKTVMSLLAMDEAALQKAMRLIEETFKFTSFRHKKKNLLFTDYGRSKLFPLSSANPIIQVDTRTRSIKLYRSPLGREAASRALENLIGQLESLELDRAFIIRRSARFQISHDAAELQRKSGVLDIRMAGNRLIASGTPASIEVLQSLIKFAISAPRPNSSASVVSTDEDCPICFESLSEVESVTLIGCDHSFCKQCVQDFLSQPELPVPVTCPLGGACKKPMILSDLLSLASAESLEKVKQLALEHFLISKKTFVHCVKEGCDQILRVPPVAELQNLQLQPGGIDVFCDQCSAHYCYACSAAMQEPLLLHPSVNCIDNRARLTTTVLGRLNYIRNEVLMSACPSCKKAFLDFSGCCAVTCSQPCGAGFCGFCFKHCGTNAHPHVRVCEFNPNPGTYFASAAEISRAQGVVKRKRLIAYLKGVASKDDQATILQDIRKDLQDLGIAPLSMRDLQE